MTDAPRHDVIVIGAGVAGASVAAELARTHAVLLVEREPHPAHHASGRSASVLSETSGHPLVCMLARLSRPFFEHPPPGFSEHRLLSPRGLLWVGEAGDEPLLDALAARARATAPTARRLTVSQVAELLPTFSGAAVAGGGVHEPDAMSIDTAELMAGWMRLLRSRGGQILTSAEVVRGGQEGNEWQVVVRRKAELVTFRAAALVDAAGAWVDEVAACCGVRPVGVTPLRRTAAVAPAPDIVTGWPLVMDVAGRYYCEPDPGGLLISPADETESVPCDAQAEELDVAIALDRVRDASGLPLRSVRRAWAGLRTFAPDRVPVVGEAADAPGFWWLAGQGGAGIKTAPAMAQLLASMVRGEPAPSEADDLGISLAALSPNRLTRTD